jgi:hypothetical protein
MSEKEETDPIPLPEDPATDVPEAGAPGPPTGSADAAAAPPVTAAPAPADAMPGRPDFPEDRGPAGSPAARKEPARPVLSEEREPLYRDAGGFRMRLEPADLVRLRELPGSKGRSDRELGEEFFEKQADRFATSLAEDVTPPAEVRVVVDPYSRQAFLAIDRTIRSILSF